MSGKPMVDCHGRAWCDIGVGVNDGKVVIDRCSEDCESRAAILASMVEDLNEKLTLQKTQKLIDFQRRVKERVNKREKQVEKEMAAAAALKHQSEQLVVERALNTKVAKCVEVGMDVEDVQVVASGRQSRFSLASISSRPPSLQAARQYLLSYSGSCSSSSKKKTESKSTHKKLSGGHSKVTTLVYHDVPHMALNCCTKRLSGGSVGSSGASSISTSSSSTTSSSFSSTSSPSSNSSPSFVSSEVPSPSLTITKNLKPAKKLEDMDQKQAGKQFLLFRRLYSELEREKVRRVRQQSKQRKKIERIRKKKEMERRIAEQDLALENESGRDSQVSTDTADDRLKAEEWQERLLSKAREIELKKAKEEERYIAALKAQLRDKMERKKVTVPPLCFCAETIWDTDPEKCANNCSFHNDSQEYIRALTNLLQSLDMV